MSNKPSHRIRRKNQETGQWENYGSAWANADGSFSLHVGQTIKNEDGTYDNSKLVKCFMMKNDLDAKPAPTPKHEEQKSVGDILDDSIPY